jgi:hypothetical protein
LPPVTTAKNLGFLEKFVSIEDSNFFKLFIAPFITSGLEPSFISIPAQSPFLKERIASTSKPL